MKIMGYLQYMYYKVFTCCKRHTIILRDPGDIILDLWSHALLKYALMGCALQAVQARSMSYNATNMQIMLHQS